MNRKKNWFDVAELAVVLLITAAIFVWGRQLALLERGCIAYGGECLLLLIPIIYYSIKSMR